VIDAQQRGVISVPPPILSRIYQTLSRGFVNLLNAKKIKDVRFPFPYAQVIAVLLLLLAIFTPFAMTSMLPHGGWCTVGTFVPVFGLLCLNYTAEELEMPFGEDHNDLPLTHFQAEMNSSLLMLIHECSDHVAAIGSRAQMDFESMSSSLHDSRNSLQHFDTAANSGHRRRGSGGRQRSSVFGKAAALASEQTEPLAGDRLEVLSNNGTDAPDEDFMKEADETPSTTTAAIDSSRTLPSQSTSTTQNGAMFSSAVRGAMTELAESTPSSALKGGPPSRSAHPLEQAEHMDVDRVGALLKRVSDLPQKGLDESRSSCTARRPPLHHDTCLQGLDASRSSMPSRLLTHDGLVEAHQCNVSWKSGSACPCPRQPHTFATFSSGLDDARRCGSCPVSCQSSSPVQAKEHEVNQSIADVERGPSPQPFFPRSSSPPARDSRTNTPTMQVAGVQQGLPLPDIWAQATTKFPSHGGVSHV